RQAQIVELGGLKLLLPLARSKDVEVQRLAVHALANLSVDGESSSSTRPSKCEFAHAPFFSTANQELMAEEGAIDTLVIMLGSSYPHLQRQASKALANLGVNAKNKERICTAGGVGPLVALAGSKSPGVAVEAVAALANLAVN
ncbi:unnamed protein product, partial [Scytosiphon promiscuus]